MTNQGVIINPVFISGFNNLKTACERLNSIKEKYGENSKEFKIAFLHRQNAENIFCNTQGIIQGNGANLLTKNQAQTKINSYNNEVKSWYA